MLRKSPKGIALTSSVAVILNAALAGCGESAPSDDAELQTEPSAAPSSADWDGKKRSETDVIVELTLDGPATSILLNGEPATALIDNIAKSARVLIPSDETGISCQNTFIVTFESGEKGQLVANHCHGDTVFDVRVGEITDALLTKEDVDNPEGDAGFSSDEAGLPLSHEWSANGFEELPARYEWMGGTQDDGNAYAALGVPETDDAVFTASCDKGEVLAFILLYDRDPEMGMNEQFKVEVGGFPVRSYSVKGREYGEGSAFALRLPPSDPFLSDMTKGEWAYWQMGSDSGTGKIRVSLQNAQGPIASLVERC